MKNYILSIAILSMISLNSFAQKENVNDFSNKLLCNAYVYGKTDTATFNFLQNNFPYLAREKPENGYLTPPEGDNAKHLITSMHFKKHPFFKMGIKEGRLDFFTVDDGGGLIFEKGAQLVLLFDTEMSADYVFNQLTDSLTRLCFQKNISTKGTQKIILFTGYANSDTYNPELALTVDDATKNYSILFKSKFDAGTGF
jgi:hypothetical protein